MIVSVTLEVLEVDLARTDKSALEEPFHRMTLTRLSFFSGTAQGGLRIWFERFLERGEEGLLLLCLKARRWLTGDIWRAHTEKRSSNCSRVEVGQSLLPRFLPCLPLGILVSWFISNAKVKSKSDEHLCQ